MKFVDALGRALHAASSPAWGRGLKFNEIHQYENYDKSSPAWGRGLKLPPPPRPQDEGNVVPRVGTWVEMGLGVLK